MIKGVFVILFYIDTAMPILGREYGTYSFPCRQNIFVIFFVTGVVVNNNHNDNNANDDASTGINAMLSIGGFSTSGAPKKLTSGPMSWLLLRFAHSKF